VARGADSLSQLRRELVLAMLLPITERHQRPLFLFSEALRALISCPAALILTSEFIDLLCLGLGTLFQHRVVEFMLR